MAAKFDRKSMITVGRALPGMQDVSRSASSNFQPTQGTAELLERLQRLGNGVVSLSVEEEELVGRQVKLKGNTWEDQLDEIGEKAGDNPCAFVLARSELDILLIKYIPENSKTKQRMLYASSMSSIKQVLTDIFGEDCRIEEFNVSERSELSFKEYDAHRKSEKPLTSAERTRMEEDSQETAGGYSLLAQLGGMGAFRLPGLGGGALPKALQPKNDAQEGARGKSQDQDQDQDQENLEAEQEDTFDESAAEKRSSKAKAMHESSKRESSKRTSSKRDSKRGSPSRKRDEEDESKRVTGKKEDLKTVEINKEPEVPQDDGLSYADLLAIIDKGQTPQGVTRANVETALSSRAFQSLLGMSKEAFLKLPAWKRTQLKKQHKLF